MAHQDYTRQRVGQVILNATAAVQARLRGETHIRLGAGRTAQTLDLEERGYCARFVRVCYETGMGFGPFSWRYRATTANGMLGAL